MERRPAIGFLVNDLVGAYQVACWSGLEEEARAQGWDLVCLAGGELGSDDQTKRMRNRAFDMARSQDLDGLVILAPALGNRLSPDDISGWLEGLQSIPMVSIGIELPGIPSILVDNEAGMLEMVEHVLGHHGRKFPLFLGGPPLNPEASARRDAFLRVAESHGVRVEPERIVNAEFDFGLGRDAVASFLIRGQPLDCVMAANDEMALGAMEALHAAGRSVPANVLVVGFDDIQDARIASPPLSTVRQPLEEQGRQAIRMMSTLLHGREKPSTIRLPARFVPRRSCACLDPTIQRTKLAPPPASGPGIRLGDVEHQMRIDHILEDHKMSGGELTFPIQLSQALEYDVEHPQAHRTVDLVEAWVSRQDNPDANALQDFLSDLRWESLATLQDDSRRTELESVLHQLRLVLAQKGNQATAWNAMRQERWTRSFHETSGRLITAFEVDTLVEELSASLNSLGIQSFYLLLTESKGALRLKLSHTGGVRDPLPTEGIVLEETKVLSGLLRRSSIRQCFTVDPLFFRETDIGFIIFELSPRRGAMYDALRTQIAASLRGAQLAKEVSTQQRQLLLSEKMAGIGRLTAGIAHEMNTPLSAVRSALEEAIKLAEEYRDSIGDAEVTPDDHGEIAKDLLKSLDLSKRAAEKASAFVRSIKSQTRDMGNRDTAVFDAAQVLEEAVLLLSHVSREANVPIEVEVQDKPFPLHGIPDRFAQIITNLIGNAIDASRDQSGKRVWVKAWKQDGASRIDVTDEGCGIPPENLERIWEPLFTTKPVGKGTGLGLTIIHDLVESDFGGHIRVESVVGQGTTFHLVFPERKV